jgi:hypothetical protein
MVGKLYSLNENIITVHRGKVNQDTAAYGISVKGNFIGVLRKVEAWKESSNPIQFGIVSALSFTATLLVMYNVFV